MGRLTGAAARCWAMVGFLLVAPLVVLLDDRLVGRGDAPTISLLLGVVVALLLSIGPRGAPAVAAVLLLEGLLGDGGPVVAVAVAALQTAAAVGIVLVLESRFRHHGPVRTPWVMVDFAVLAAAALPVAHAVAPVAVDLVRTGTGDVAGVLPAAVAHGLGVLAVTAGVRMLLMGERIEMEPRLVRGILLAVIVASLAVVVPLLGGGTELLVGGQLVMVPLLVVALLGGTAAYAVAALLTSLALLLPAGLTGLLGEVPTSWGTEQQGLTWLVLAAGYLLAVDRDRRRAMDRQYEALFTFGATPTAILVTDGGVLLRSNAALASLLEVEHEALAGRAAADLVGGAPAPTARLVALLDGTERHAEFEFSLTTGSGRQRWVRCAAVRIPLGGPQADVVQVQLLDLTAERERREGLERSNHALERLGRRVAHDLTQPLAAIAGFARTLDVHHEAMDAEMRTSMLRRLDAVAQGTIEQLQVTLDHALQRGSATALSDLEEVVASVTEMADLQLAAGTLTASLEVTRVAADPTMLRLVLGNLVGNSIKYAREDEPLRIQITSRRHGDGVEIRVADNGIGVPEEALGEIFEPGARLAPGHAAGHGLGLSDSRDLVEAAGGSLRAEPSDHGACFVLWLPQGPAVAERGGRARVTV